MATRLSDQLLFNGIHRFIYEDYFATTENISKNQLRQLTKQIAYQVIQRSNAWSNLLEKQFPYAIRLSIHPQAFHSKKIGIMLLESRDTWATPWHRVMVKSGHQHVLMRKIEAEKLGAQVVLQAGVFSHYEMRG
jgi:pyoverdine/dityrosine biosynthesis protein Dit1